MAVTYSFLESSSVTGTSYSSPLTLSGEGRALIIFYLMFYTTGSLTMTLNWNGDSLSGVSKTFYDGTTFYYRTGILFHQNSPDTGTHNLTCSVFTGTAAYLRTYLFNNIGVQYPEFGSDSPRSITSSTAYRSFSPYNAETSTSVDPNALYVGLGTYLSGQTLTLNNLTTLSSEIVAGNCAAKTGYLLGTSIPSSFGAQYSAQDTYSQEFFYYKMYSPITTFRRNYITY